MVTCTIAMREQGKFVGVSTVDLKLEGLADLFAKAGHKVNGYLFALDKNDRFLAFPDPELISNKNKNGGIKPALSFIDSNVLGHRAQRFAPVCRKIVQINGEILKKAKKLPQFQNKLVQILDQESYQISCTQKLSILIRLLIWWLSI